MGGWEVHRTARGVQQGQVDQGQGREECKKGNDICRGATAGGQIGSRRGHSGREGCEYTGSAVHGVRSALQVGGGGRWCPWACAAACSDRASGRSQHAQPQWGTCAPLHSCVGVLCGRDAEEAAEPQRIRFGRDRLIGSGQLQKDPSVPTGTGQQEGREGGACVWRGRGGSAGSSQPLPQRLVVGQKVVQEVVHLQAGHGQVGVALQPQAGGCGTQRVRHPVHAHLPSQRRHPAAGAA